MKIKSQTYKIITENTYTVNNIEIEMIFKTDNGINITVGCYYKERLIDIPKDEDDEDEPRFTMTRVDTFNLFMDKAMYKNITTKMLYKYIENQISLKQRA